MNRHISIYSFKAISISKQGLPKINIAIWSYLYVAIYLFIYLSSICLSKCLRRKGSALREKRVGKRGEMGWGWELSEGGGGVKGRGGGINGRREGGGGGDVYCFMSYYWT